MEIRELRIGNYIDYNGEIMKLDGSLLCCYIQNELEFPLNPIPLTEEILMDFGFEKKGDWFFQNENFTIEHWILKNKWTLRLRINPRESIELCDFYFVHQLQNLYFTLTGDELKLKEKLT